MTRTQEPDQLKRVDILLRCEKPNHNNCSIMTQALIKNCKDVLEVNTTRTKIDNTDYCVAGTALVNENDVKNFRKNLKNVKSDDGTGVKNLKLYTST